MRIGFAIWALCGILFLGIGVFSFCAKKPVGFWANIKTPPIGNVRSYNRAVGKLWCGYGAVFVLLGFPLLDGQNSPLVFGSVLGVVFETIVLMVLYLRVEQKYRKR